MTMETNPKEILKTVATNSCVLQMVALQDEEDGQLLMGSSNKLPNNASKSSDKQANDAYRRNKKKLCCSTRDALDKVTAKVNQLREMEAAAYRNMKKPIFSSSELKNPLNFLEDLNNYFTKLPMEHRTIDTAIECLQGPAKDWALMKKDQWPDIEEFKKDFTEQYWGISSQTALRGKIITGSYGDEEGSMNSYFIRIISQARWLPNKIADEELVSDLMKHFPRHVQVAWYLSEKKTVIEAAEFLRKMDEIDKLCASKEAHNKCQTSKCTLPSSENALNDTHDGDLDCNQSDSKRMKYGL